MPCQAFSQAFGSIFHCHVTHCQRVVSHDGFANYANVSLACPGLLVLPGIAHEIPVQFLATAIEVFDQVVPAKFFDTPAIAHWRVSVSKNPGSFRRRSRRGSGRGGASSAARNFFHCAAFSPNLRRSARASSARAKALSSTNSLTERFEAAAAACNAVLASGVSRKSSFSLRVVRADINKSSSLQFQG